MDSTAPRTLAEAVAQFLSANGGKNAVKLQDGLQRFVHWSGGSQPVARLTSRQVEAFCEASAGGPLEKLGALKAFLAYAGKKGLTPSNLAVHVKIRRAQAPAGKSSRPVPRAVIRLSGEAIARVEEELQQRKGERVPVAEELRRAMADKDFRENAPLDAAREKQGHLEARIRDLEHTLRYAQPIDGAADADVPADGARSRQGSRVVVRDIALDEELAYTLVGRTEVDSRSGRISVDSPVGKAFLDRAPGDIVTVAAPGGAHRYRIERVE